MKLNFKSPRFGMPLSTLENWVNVGIALILCSKFYFLWGVSNSYQPIAPIGIILIRDIIVFGFLMIFGLLMLKSFPKTKFFWILWFFGFVVSIYQLVNAKDFVTWAHHYLRNLLLPMLFYPVMIALFSSGIRISITKLLVGLYFLDIFICYFQLFLNTNIIRPSGIFGDAIINSMILFWGLFAVLLSGRKWVSVFAVISFLPLLQRMASISSIVAFFVGLTLVLFIERKKWRRQFALWISVWALILVSISSLAYSYRDSFGPDQLKNFEGLSGKVLLLYDNIFCHGPFCHKKSWSLEGRIASSIRPIEICKESMKECFLGSNTPIYERMESTIGSLIANFGLFFFLLFLFWIFIHFPMLKVGHSVDRRKNADEITWLLIFCSTLIFTVLNTMPYRHPLNILFYISMAYFFSRYLNQTELRKALNNS